METSIQSKQERVELILSLFDERAKLGAILREIEELPVNEMWPVSVKATEHWTAHFFITKAMVRQQVLALLQSLPTSIEQLSREVANGD